MAVSVSNISRVDMWGRIKIAVVVCDYAIALREVL
jgi:hypothetical protein